MRTYLTWMVCLLLIMCGAAQAAVPNQSADDWNTVEHLAPGTVIHVQSGDMAGADRCALSTADDSGLTCLDQNSASDRRLIFPRSQVREVWVDEVAPNRHILKWTFATAGMGLLIALLAENPLAGLVVSAAVLFAMEAVENNPYRVELPPRPPRMRRRLVYRAATP